MLEEEREAGPRGAPVIVSEIPVVRKLVRLRHYDRGVWDRGGRRRRRVKSLRYEFPLAAHRRWPGPVVGPHTTSGPGNHLSPPPRLSRASSSSTLEDTPLLLRGFCFKASQGSSGRDKWYPSGRDQSINYVQRHGDTFPGRDRIRRPRTRSVPEMSEKRDEIRHAFSRRF